MLASKFKPIYRKMRLLIFLSVLIIGYLILWTFLKVIKLPTVENPVEFTQGIDPHQEQSVNLNIGSEGNFWPSGRSISSPLFPYKNLTTTSIEAYDCPRRYVNMDTLWKVFWVEIAECGKRTKFFGPYRLN